MSPSELFQAGRLTDAVDAAVAEVKKHPTDTARRGFLCELLCFAGQWERADTQLDTIGKQDPQAVVGLVLLRQLIRAEVARQQFFDEGRVPEFVAEPSAVFRLHLEASIALREGKPDEAATLLERAEQERTKPHGTCDGQPFDDLRDLDDLTAPVFEVFTRTGKYYWIPIEQVRLVEFHAPERPHDLLWRRAHLVVEDGPDGEVFFPTLYAATCQCGDDQLRLGRGTDWEDKPGQPVRGIGQRMFLVGEKDRSIMEIKEIRIKADG